MISLVSYEPADPVWFFSTGAHQAPVNFAGRIGAFLAELSFQLFGYASYVIPAVLVVIGRRCAAPPRRGSRGVARPGGPPRRAEGHGHPRPPRAARRQGAVAGWGRR